MREIVLDTETTGLDPANGDRIVEIGCLEAGQSAADRQDLSCLYQSRARYAARGRGGAWFERQFLADKPVFAEIADDFIAFVKGAALIIHNAAFDMKFLHAELAFLGRDDLREAKIIDTLTMARKKFPGAPASLDALCRRFGVDNSGRDLHGALIDSELLAGVYLELSGGRQPGLVFQADSGKAAAATDAPTTQADGQANRASRRAPASRDGPAKPAQRRRAGRSSGLFAGFAAACHYGCKMIMAMTAR